MILARSGRNTGDEESDPRCPAFVVDPRHLQPRSSGCGAGVDRSVLLRRPLELMLQRIAGPPLELDMLLADIHSRRFGQAQCLEELLDARQARRLGSLDGIEPAIVLVPPRHCTGLEEWKCLLGGRLGLLGQLAW